MPKSNRRRMSVRQSGVTGAFEAVIHPHQSWPGRIVGALVRARAELFVLGVVVWLYFGWLADMNTAYLIAVVAITVVVLVAVRPIRLFLSRRFWCVMSRHRARTCFRSTWTMTYTGRLPLLLWSRPTPVGERIRVWLPAGLAVNDLERVSDKLASACWARACRVEADPKRAASAVIHVIRRDPLEKAQVSPDIVGRIRRAATGRIEDAPLPSRAEVLEELAEAPAESPRTEANGKPGKQRNSRPKPSTASTKAEPVVHGVGGMDMSDYV